MKHSRYFDGRVQSLELRASDGARATVGVVEPGNYTFSTASEEHISVIEGVMNARLPGSDWKRYAKGEEFVVPADSSFDIEANADVVYLCVYR